MPPPRPLRRRFLRALALASPTLVLPAELRAQAVPQRRVRPGDAGWPRQKDWDLLRTAVGGRLRKLPRRLKPPPAPLVNPWAVSDEPALTQASGWVSAWRSTPSVYAVAVTSTADVVAAVKFARAHRLRLVVKGGGHSYQGTSCAPDSLLVWMRPMRKIAMHGGFVPRGCNTPPQPAVTIDAGAVWMEAYDAVTTRGGRLVQGGGCATVGVAGLIQSGGFGVHSKHYGLAAGSLLEAEVVTADGIARTVNACRDPELFWALKGGGGGTFGIVTRVTLRTHDLPALFGAALFTVKAHTDEAFGRLLETFVTLYRDRLCNPHWGDQVHVEGSNRLRIAMVSNGLDEPAMRAAWRPLFDLVAQSPTDFAFEGKPIVAAFPARKFWDRAFLEKLPGVIGVDDRPGAPKANVFWINDQEQVGMDLYAYRSAWLPRSALEGDAAALADGLFAASRHWRVQLHVNKGLSGASPEALAAARETATHPAVLDAFALAIVADAGPPSYPQFGQAPPDLARAAERAGRVRRAMDALLTAVPSTGSYVSESDFFENDWQDAFWGSNYPRLLAVKRRYDPDGLFFVRHGVGSEGWSADGFTGIA